MTRIRSFRCLWQLQLLSSTVSRQQAIDKKGTADFVVSLSPHSAFFRPPSHHGTTKEHRNQEQQMLSTLEHRFNNTLSKSTSLTQLSLQLAKTTLCIPTVTYDFFRIPLYKSDHPHLLPEFHNLTHLCLELNIATIPKRKLILEFLLRCPKLEVLIIPLGLSNFSRDHEYALNQLSNPPDHRSHSLSLPLAASHRLSKIPRVATDLHLNLHIHHRRPPPPPSSRSPATTTISSSPSYFLHPS
ncbi:hypothetical protein P8452_22371 [Trifolium repens]|nr:hypothetical protein P8452_22371 [Trifolium repens]